MAGMSRAKDLVGRRVKVIALTNPEVHVRPGSKGTVLSADEDGVLYVRWDNGAHLGLLPGDKFRLLPAPASKS